MQFSTMLPLLMFGLMLTGTSALVAKSSLSQHAQQKDKLLTSMLKASVLASNATKTRYLRAMVHEASQGPISHDQGPFSRDNPNGYVEPYHQRAPLIFLACVMIFMIGCMALCIFICCNDDEPSEKRERRPRSRSPPAPTIYMPAQPMMIPQAMPAQPVYHSHPAMHNSPVTMMPQSMPAMHNSPRTMMPQSMPAMHNSMPQTMPRSFGSYPGQSSNSQTMPQTMPGAFGSMSRTNSSPPMYPGASGNFSSQAYLPPASSGFGGSTSFKPGTMAGLGSTMGYGQSTMGYGQSTMGQSTMGYGQSTMASNRASFNGNYNGTTMGLGAPVNSYTPGANYGNSYGSTTRAQSAGASMRFSSMR